MSDENRIDYTDILTAVRKGDEEAYEFLYNDTVRTCRARCMKYFDAATEEGRRKTDLAVRDIYIRLHDEVHRLSDPEDFLLLARRQTREVCERMLEEETVLLAAEEYIDVAGADSAPSDEPELVTADACRAEVKETAVMSEESITALVLAVLHRLTAAQRRSLILWNGNDDRAFRDPGTLREAFIRVEQSVMELEQRHDLRAKDFAQSRLAFFNWLLDLYDRFCQASTKDWNGAEEPALALALDPDAELTEVVSLDAETSFRDIWDNIRSAFYIRNTMELPGGLQELLAAEESAKTEDDFTVYLDGEDREEGSFRREETPPAPKRGPLSKWWVRLLVGLLIILLVLAAVIATAGQHTSHALASAEAVSAAVHLLFMQCADFIF